MSRHCCTELRESYRCIYNWNIPQNVILDSVLQMSASALFICPINRLFILYQISVSFTDGYIFYWLASVVFFCNVTPAQILQSSSREYNQKQVSVSMRTHTERDAILTSQSRRVQSRCPTVWPPHAAQKDWSCWGADKAWTTRPWAGHRADILQSSPKNKETYKKHNWSSTELMPSRPKGWYLDEMYNFSHVSLLRKSSFNK